MPLVAANLGLAFPVPLIEGANQFLKREELGRLADSRDLIFEPIWKTLVVLVR